MSKIRCQVITRTAAQLPIDHIVNTVYFDDFNLDPTGATNWQAFATDVRNAFNQRNNMGQNYGTECKVYDMADAEPRPIKASSPWVLGTSTSQSQIPREVALCLSYFSERNLPRFRGRIYLGALAFAAERPSAGDQTAWIALGQRLAGVGGIDVDWQLFSPTRNAYSKITDIWVDNEWDTVRSRGYKGTSRARATTGE
jgi:hypothetical protein